MLSGFISLCQTVNECIYSKPLTSWYIKYLIVLGSGTLLFKYVFKSDFAAGIIK